MKKPCETPLRFLRRGVQLCRVEYGFDGFRLLSRSRDERRLFKPEGVEVGVLHGQLHADGLSGQLRYGLLEVHEAVDAVAEQVAGIVALQCPAIGVQQTDTDVAGGRRGEVQGQAVAVEDQGLRDDLAGLVIAAPGEEAVQADRVAVQGNRFDAVAVRDVQGNLPGRPGEIRFRLHHAVAYAGAAVVPVVVSLRAGGQEGFLGPAERLAVAGGHDDRVGDGGAAAAPAGDELLTVLPVGQVGEVLSILVTSSGGTAISPDWASRLTAPFMLTLTSS